MPVHTKIDKAPFHFNGKQHLFKAKDYRDFPKWEEMYE
jgi:hypothetical protein